MGRGSVGGMDGIDYHSASGSALCNTQKLPTFYK